MLYWLATSKVPSGNGFLNTSYRMISLLRQDDKSIRRIETLLSVHPHLSKVLDISLHRESGVWPRYPSAAKPLWLFLSENAFVAGNLVFWLMSRWFERPPSTAGLRPRLTCFIHLYPRYPQVGPSGNPRLRVRVTHLVVSV